MPLWKAPSATPLHIVLLSGHAIWIGPEPREVPEFFLSHVIAAGAIAVPADTERKRGRPKKIGGADPAAPADADAESAESPPPEMETLVLPPPLKAPHDDAL